MDIVEGFDYRRSAFVKYLDVLLSTGRQQIPVARANVNRVGVAYCNERQRIGTFQRESSK